MMYQYVIIDKTEILVWATEFEAVVKLLQFYRKYHPTAELFNLQKVGV